MLGRLRERFRKIMAPIGRKLSRTGITPNALSVIGLLLGLTVAYAYGVEATIIGALFIILIGFVDMLDGAVARATDRTTRFGTVLDHVLDRYVECFIVLGIIYGGYVHWLWGTFSLFGMFMASFVRAKAESVGGLKSCTTGIAERQEKLLIIIIGSILDPLLPSIKTLNYAVLLVGVLSHITVIQRLSYTWKQTGGF